MRCETCHGYGTIRGEQAADGVYFWQWCTECGGSGFTHCCEGLREQPEEKRDE